jgi:hypothetical protein
MNTAGKHKRRRFDPQRRKKSLMGSALKHEALADELDKFNALENFGMM